MNETTLSDQEKEELKKKTSLSLKDKIDLGVYPNKDMLLSVYDKDHNREEICLLFNISHSTFKKLVDFYQLPPKERKVNKEDYIIRGITLKKTMSEKYGELGSKQRNQYYLERSEKTQNTCLLKYGERNPMILQEIKEKVKATCLEKFGCENPMQNKEIQEKAKLTDLEKYGVEYHISSNEVREKIEQSLLKKFGTLKFTGLPEISSKREQTNLKKYGYITGLCNPDIRHKGYLKMKQNGQDGVATSKQQVYLNELFHGELNHIFGIYHADIYLNEDNIVIEYSGGGHNLGVKMGKISEEEFSKKEERRKGYFKNNNILVIEFVSRTDKLPDDSILFNCLQQGRDYFAQSKDNLYFRIDLDNFR